MLHEVLPEHERTRLEHFETEMLLSGEEMAAVQERGFHGDCYLDPQLSTNPKTYHMFLADLFDAKLISFTNKPRVQVGAFVVTKKGGKQRLIIDARRTNKLFRTPPTTVLGSVDAWGRLEIDEEHGELFVAQEDVKDYFYRLAIGKTLGEYFCLPKVDAMMLNDVLGYIPAELQELIDVSSASVYPHLCVLPMGFSWAFHLAHEVHCHLARRSIPGVPHLRDRRAAPVLGRGKGKSVTGVLIYADNANHFGVEERAVAEDQRRLMETLHDHNLDTHDITSPSTLAESLGVRINGLSGEVQATPHRDWRLHRALPFLSKRPVISGEQLQVILGHVTVRALINRNLMGIMRHAYVFVEKCYAVRVRLWRSVAEELDIFRSLMPLGISNFRSPWDEHPLCTDACLSGYAVMESSHGQDVAALHGRHDERWRFKRQEGSKVGPRELALGGADVFSDVRTVKPGITGEVEAEFELDSFFPEVWQEHLREEHWHLLWNSPISFPEPVHLIEARSVLAALKHRARDVQRHGKRILVFNDNMGVVLSIQKGRSCSYGLLRLIRRISAHCLATGIRLAVRWVPSEFNVADSPSRQWEEDRRNCRAERVKEDSSSFFKGGSERVQPEDEEPTERGVGEPKEKREVAVKRAGRGHGSSRHAVEEDDETGNEEERESKSETAEVPQEVEGHQWVHGHFGAWERERTSKERLCQAAAGILRFRRPARLASTDREGAGRGFVRLRRSFVSEWRRERCRTKAQGRYRVCPAGGHEERGTSPPKVQEEPEGVAEISAVANQTPHDRVCQEQHQCHHAAHRTSNDGPIQRADLLHLCAARGDDEDPGRRCGGKKQAVSPPCGGRSTLRERGKFKERHLRRSADLGRFQDDGARRHCGRRVQEGLEGKRRRGKDVELLRSAIPEGVEGMCPGSPSRSSSRKPIPEQARWCLKGSPSEVALSGRNTEKGAVGSRCQRQSLRQAGEIAADHQQIQQQVGALGRRDKEELHELFLRQVHSVAQGDPEASHGEFQGLSFLSLFGGEGNPAKFFAKKGGNAFVVDICDSPKNDLGLHSRWNRLLSKIQLFDFVGVDLPCNTWSRARRAPWWSKLPKPLRQEGEYIMGLSSLSASDQDKVSRANVMLQRSVQLIRKCLRLGIPGYLENPRNSLVWKTPCMQRLLKHRHVQLIVCDMCQYGTQWRKPTAILVWHCRPFSLKACSGHGKCSRTHKPHLQLTGLGGKRFLTSQAQVYTSDFSQHLMLSLHSHQLSNSGP